MHCSQTWRSLLANGQGWTTPLLDLLDMELLANFLLTGVTTADEVAD